MQKDRDAYLLSSYLIIFKSIDVFEMSIIKMPFFGFEACKVCIRYLIFLSKRYTAFLFGKFRLVASLMNHVDH